MGIKINCTLNYHILLQIDKLNIKTSDIYKLFQLKISKI